MRLQVAELLIEVEFTKQEGERGAHILGQAVLQLHFKSAIVGRGVYVKECAVGNAELAYGMRVIATHAAGLAQVKGSAFRALGAASRRILFSKRDLQRFRDIVAVFYILEQALERRRIKGRGSECRHRQQRHSKTERAHKGSDAREGGNVYSALACSQKEAFTGPRPSDWPG